jgi:secondary thiamine-phosphate synthase enzyme
MTTVEVPYSIAAALPSLSVMDITNDVSREVAESSVTSGIAYLHTASTLSLVRVQERETGFFEDLESLLERVVPGKLRSREHLVAFLLGPRSEHIPFSDGALCLGQWQRILLFSLDAQHRPEWTLTLVG